MNAVQLYASKELGFSTKEGTILDENNQPYTDVYVINKTRNLSTITNKNGSYRIEYSPNDIIEISHVSFGKKTYPADFLPKVLSIDKNYNELNEVVLVAKKHPKATWKRYVKPVGIGIGLIALVTGVIYYNKYKTIEVNG